MEMRNGRKKRERIKKIKIKKKKKTTTKNEEKGVSFPQDVRRSYDVTKDILCQLTDTLTILSAGPPTPWASFS